MGDSIHLENISFSYPGYNYEVISSLSMTWISGETLGIIGPSASGKTTLGKLIKGLIEPSKGSIHFLKADLDVILNSEDRLSRIGWVGAHPEIQIFALNVSEEVGFGLRNQGVAGEEIDQRVNEALQNVGLDPEIYSKLAPLQLSGGEKRRVAIASITSMKYDWFVFDEPTVGLDYYGLRDVRTLVKKLTSNGCGVIWISHDSQSVKEVADRVLTLQVEEKGDYANNLNT